MIGQTFRDFWFIITTPRKETLGSRVYVVCPGRVERPGDLKVGEVSHETDPRNPGTTDKGDGL